MASLDKVRRQTAAPASLNSALKSYAASKNMYLEQVHEAAIVALIKHRQELQSEGRSVVYLASPTDGEIVNMMIKRNLLKRIVNISPLDKTNVRRFLYTALVYFHDQYIAEFRM